MMNAVRWNPLATNSASITLTATNFYPKYNLLPMQFNLILSVDPSAPGAPPVALPYSNSEKSCTSVLLGPRGASILESSEPLSFINSNSPIRPVCFSVTTGPPDGVRFEDFIISAGVPNTTVKISGSVEISPFLDLPTGFLPINFTRAASLSGQLSHAIQIESNPSFSNPITLTLPQATLYAGQFIKNLQTISVLKYDGYSGKLSHITPTIWRQDSLTSPMVMTVTLPSDGYYIFGHMDMTKGARVPVASNQWVDYLKEYGKLAVQVDNSPLVFEFLATKSTRFAIMKPYEITWDPDGYEILDRFYLTGEYPPDKDNQINATLNYIHDGLSPLLMG